MRRWARVTRVWVCTLGFWCMAIAIHVFAARFVAQRGVARLGASGTPPLHDILHELLPNTQAVRLLPEVAYPLPILYLVARLLHRPNARSWVCLRSFLWCHGTLMLCRAASFVVTLLPDASGQCHSSPYLGGCHDLMFSGHVMIMTLAALYVTHYFDVPRCTCIALGVTVFVVSLLIIVSRNHYTVDVFLAVVIATLAYIAFTWHPCLMRLGQVS